MITIWRRCECTQIDDAAPRFVWVRMSDFEIARAASEAARRRYHASDREDLRSDIRAIVREEVAREVLRVTVISPLADEIRREVEAAVAMATQRTARAMRYGSDAG